MRGKPCKTLLSLRHHEFEDWPWLGMLMHSGLLTWDKLFGLAAVLCGSAQNPETLNPEH